MTSIVFEEGGTLDKYIGDALMAFWGAPVRRRTTRSAPAGPRSRCWKRWSSSPALAGRELAEIEIGVGINSGPMVVGNMGSDVRFDYTVMGDAVNLASRLEGANKLFEHPHHPVRGHLEVCRLAGHRPPPGLGAGAGQAASR